MDVVFLDFDGVINTPTGYDVNGSYRDNYNGPADGRVNNYQAIKLLNKLCLEHNLAIVVSSKGGWRNSLRRDESGNYIISPYKQILYDSGLDEHVYIYGNTPPTEFNKDMEIKIYLSKHPEVKKFVILDDIREEISRDLDGFLVLCSGEKGFTERDLKRAVEIINNQPEINRGSSYIVER